LRSGRGLGVATNSAEAIIVNVFGRYSRTKCGGPGMLHEYLFAEDRRSPLVRLPILLLHYGEVSPGIPLTWSPW